MRPTIALLLLLCSCNKHTGLLNENCNPDGTCSSPNLECHSWSNTSECRAKEPPVAPFRCRGDAECFCLTCNDNCADAGIRTCAFSDTSVWGSKPSVCECK